MGLDLAYTGGRSAFVHAGAAKRMVVEFKSGGQPVLAPLMARLAGPAFDELLAAVGTPRPAEPVGPHGCAGNGAGSAGPVSATRRDAPVLLTWVPCHPTSQRERGYNQAELLARALARGRPDLVTAGSTRKPVKTKHQKALGRAGRQSNLRGAFVLDDASLRALPFRPVAAVLIDDVYTTGATVQEVSRVLREGTGIPIYVFTFSRAVAGRSEGHD
jgi:predicted amidophosphoribosyltransferase